MIGHILSGFKKIIFRIQISASKAVVPNEKKTINEISEV